MSEPGAKSEIAVGTRTASCLTARFFDALSERILLHFRYKIRHFRYKIRHFSTQNPSLLIQNPSFFDTKSSMFTSRRAFSSAAGGPGTSPRGPSGPGARYRPAKNAATMSAIKTGRPCCCNGWRCPKAIRVIKMPTCFWNFPLKIRR